MKEISMKQLIALAYRGVEAMDAENAETKKTLEQMMMAVINEEAAKKSAQASETMNTAEAAGNVENVSKKATKKV